MVFMCGFSEIELDNFIDKELTDYYPNFFVWFYLG